MTTSHNSKSCYCFQHVCLSVCLCVSINQTLRCLQKEMATYRLWSVSLWRDPDDVSHCGIVSRQNWMAAYLGYTLRMRTLFRGWPIMVNNMHTRRRINQKVVLEKYLVVWTTNIREILSILAGVYKHVCLFHQVSKISLAWQHCNCLCRRCRHETWQMCSWDQNAGWIWWQVWHLTTEVQCQPHHHTTIQCLLIKYSSLYKHFSSTKCA